MRTPARPRRGLGSFAKAACGAALLLLLLPAGRADASGPAGTVAARESEINLNPVGVGYYHRTLRMAPREGNFRTTTFSQEQFFAEAAGEMYGWNAFVRGGAATLADEDAGGENRFDEGHRPFFGAGLRYHVPLSDDGATILAGTVRISYTLSYRGTDRTSSPPAALPDRAKVKDFWSGDLTLALQRRFGPVAFFAGPALQYSRLKVVRTEAEAVTVESRYDTASNLLGVIGGVRADLGKVTIQAEAQSFDTISYGATLSYGF
jgi:hypothetical protein